MQPSKTLDKIDIVQRELIPEYGYVDLDVEVRIGFRKPTLSDLNSIGPNLPLVPLMAILVDTVNGVPASDFGGKLWWYDFWSGCESVKSRPITNYLMDSLMETLKALSIGVQEEDLEERVEHLRELAHHHPTPAPSIDILTLRIAHTAYRQKKWWSMLGKHLGTYYTHEDLLAIQGKVPTSGPNNFASEFFNPLALSLSPGMNMYKTIKDMKVAPRLGHSEDELGEDRERLPDGFDFDLGSDPFGFGDIKELPLEELPIEEDVSLPDFEDF